MKPSAAKGKASQLDRSRSSHRAHRTRAPRPAQASGPTPSYLQTRVRASRLYEAAFILAFIELTRRLHQAYEHAYDQQAAGWVLPQQPAPGSFWDCFGKAGLSGTNFNADAADLINKLNQIEGTSRELLAVTMKNEGNPPFDVYSQPNTANNSPNPYAWDYGPFQLNAHQTFSDVLAFSYNIHGIDLDLAFGNFNGAAGQRFNGDPVENGRIAARKLNWLTRAYGEEKAAGRYTGGSRVAYRMKQYRDYASKFRDFFKCYRKAQ